MTKQRKIVLNIVKSNRRHLTAAQIYDKAVRKLPNIGVGTVYRNLNILADDGEIRRIFVLDEPVRFDGDLNPHHHLICLDCSKVVDVVLENLDLPREFEEEGFSVSNYELSGFGVCAKCKKKRDKRK